MQISFAAKMRDGLRFVGDHPEAASKIGLIPYGSNSFFVNSRICGAFFGIKANSCNHNCKQHEFVLDKDYEITQALRDRYPDIALSPRTWSLRTFRRGRFNGQSGDDEIAVATIAASQSRRPQRAQWPLANPLALPGSGAEPIIDPLEPLDEDQSRFFGGFSDEPWFTLY
jgi:hypothetical protein